MKQRLINVLYALLHIPILVILITGFSDEISRSPYNYSEYNVICDATDEAVVLQGSLNDEPWSASHYVIIEPYDRQGFAYQQKEMRFYCQFQEEIKTHIIEYRQAKHDLEAVNLANNAYFQFRESKFEEVSPKTNYTIKLVKEDIRWLEYYMGYVWIIIIAILYYLLLQGVRLLYQYVVYGRVTLHPYKKPKHKN